MSTPASPSKDPADDGTLSGTLRTVFRKMMQGVDGMLPAVVLAYDRKRNVATVRPLVQVKTTAGENVQRAQVAEVPVLALGAGGFAITWPVRAGDLGWIEASDRDISLYLQAQDEAPPNTLRMHSFEDARFIPDAMRQYTIAGEDADRLTIQSLDSSTRIAIGAGIVKITSPGTVEIVSPTTAITGNVTVSGTVVAMGDVTGAGISLSTHRHTGVQTGGGTTGTPV